MKAYDVVKYLSPLPIFWGGDLMKSRTFGVLWWMGFVMAALGCFNVFRLIELAESRGYLAGYRKGYRSFLGLRE